MTRISRNLKSRKNNKMSREERLKQLTKLGVEACATRGIQRATHADIAELAGISIPTVFSYFPNSEILLDAVLDEVSSYFIALLTETSEKFSNKTARERVIEMVKACTSLREPGPSYIIVLISWGALIRSPVWKKFQDFYDETINIFCGELEKGIEDASVPKDLDTHEAATIIVGETNMIAMMAFSTERRRINNFIVHYVDAALRFQLEC